FRVSILKLPCPRLMPSWAGVISLLVRLSRQLPRPGPRLASVTTATFPRRICGNYGDHQRCQPAEANNRKGYQERSPAALTFNTSGGISCATGLLNFPRLQTASIVAFSLGTGLEVPGNFKPTLLL